MKLSSCFLLALSLSACTHFQSVPSSESPGIRIKTGIEVLKEQKFAPLKGKRVGLITNPTGVDNNLQSTADVLFNAPEVNLVALFGPEHGVRGDAHAGDAVGNNTDPVTGLPVFSLYGATRKPSREMLRGIDVLVYDIQDIGSRSFTYISTMGAAMEAAAENDIDFMVLDRPNPIGGERIEGNVVEEGCFSFVSKFPIPYVYGLTCGELALLLNGEKMIAPDAASEQAPDAASDAASEQASEQAPACRLTVIPMQGWTRSMTYEQTGLQWIPSSPHIPHPYSAYFYPLSGIVGELGTISIGVGYTLPFQIFGTEDIDARQLAENLNAIGLPGLYFRPIYYKPYYAVGKDRPYQGVQVHILDYRTAPLTPVNFYVLQEMHKMDPARDFFKLCNPSRIKMLEKVCGSREVVAKFGERYLFADIEALWNKDVEAFRALSAKYYLYK